MVGCGELGEVGCDLVWYGVVGCGVVWCGEVGVVGCGKGGVVRFGVRCRSRI